MFVIYMGTASVVSSGLNLNGGLNSFDMALNLFWECYTNLYINYCEYVVFYVIHPIWSYIGYKILLCSDRILLCF